MIDCQTATNVVAPLLAKAGIGTFELIPSYYMEEEKKADGTTVRQIKAAIGARHVKHVSRRVRPQSVALLLLSIGCWTQ